MHCVPDCQIGPNALYYPYLRPSNAIAEDSLNLISEKVASFVLRSSYALLYPIVDLILPISANQPELGTRLSGRFSRGKSASFRRSEAGIRHEENLLALNPII